MMIGAAPRHREASGGQAEAPGGRANPPRAASRSARHPGPGDAARGAGEAVPDAQNAGEMLVFHSIHEASLAINPLIGVV
jgi:hypothetical protein